MRKTHGGRFLPSGKRCSNPRNAAESADEQNVLCTELDRWISEGGSTNRPRRQRAKDVKTSPAFPGARASLSATVVARKKGGRL